MNNVLTSDDIRDLLIGFAAAIELDQIRVDALPPERFHHEYSGDMWRRWRRNHLDYINQLLPTVEAIPAAILEKLTWIATHFEPAAVREVALDVFADAAANSVPMEDLETATQFFDRLIMDVINGYEASFWGERRALLQWLPVTDPLRISQDPECGYGLPSGFVS